MKKQPRIDVYQDSAGEHRWRLIAANGRVIADSGEGYSRRHVAVEAAERMLVVVADAPAIRVIR